MTVLDKPCLLVLAACWVVACAPSHSPSSPTGPRSAPEQKKPELFWKTWGTPGVKTPSWWLSEPEEADSEISAESADGGEDGELDAKSDAMRVLEDQLFEEINRLRNNPASYTDALVVFRNLYQDRLVAVPGQLALLTKEGKSAVDEAIGAIRQAAPQRSLRRSLGLSRAARAHARDLSRTTKLTHLGGDGSSAHHRMMRHGTLKGTFAENIGAGYSEADLLLMELLVDDSVPSRVHRIHLLAPMFTVVGIGCSVHPAYRVVCVMDFAESFEERKIKKKQTITGG